jgi:hypothetical protein
LQGGSRRVVNFKLILHSTSSRVSSNAEGVIRF